MKAIHQISTCILIVFLLFSLSYTIGRAQPVEPRKTAKKAEKRPIQVIDSGNGGFEFEMVSFEKEKDYLDEPFEFSSADAEELWDFFVLKEPHFKKDLKDMKFSGGSFAHLGSDSFLIEYYAFYFAQPKQGKLTKLTSPLPLGNYDLGEIRKLGKNKYWVLLSGGDYNHNTGTSMYYALVFEIQPDSSVIAKSLNIAHFQEYGEGLCDDNIDNDLGYPNLESTTHVDNYSIKDINHDGREDIVFFVKEQNCKTRKIRQRQRVFLNLENGFIEKSLTSGVSSQAAAP